MSVHEDRLIFSSVGKADHGPIMCKAVNPAGEDSIDVRLTVVGTRKLNLQVEAFLMAAFQFLLISLIRTKS